MDFSASKWSLPLAYRLVTATSPMRFRDLQRDIPTVSGQELTRLLRRFEQQGLVIRDDTVEPVRRITYRPSESLLDASSTLRKLASWSRKLADDLSSK